MKVIEAPRQAKTELPDAEALIKEARQRQQRRWFSIGAVLVAVILVVGLLVALSGSSRRTGPPATQQAPVTTTGITPPRQGDLSFVSFHGLQIAVPATWPLDDQTCGTPQGNTVLLPDEAVTTCAAWGPANLMVVTFFELSTAIRLGWGKAAFHTVTNAGQKVSMGWLAASRQSPRLLVLFARQVGAAVGIQSPSRTTAQRLMGSVRVVTVDADGCPSKVRDLHPAGPSSLPGAAIKLVPGAPTGVALCRYEYRWLAESAHASGHALSTLVRILNGLKPGTSHVTGHGGESPAACDQDAARGFLLRFSYPSAAIDSVFVHISGCGALSSSNGSRSGQINLALVTALTQALGYEGFPDPSELVDIP